MSLTILNVEGIDGTSRILPTLMSETFLRKFDPPKVVPDKASEFNLNNECQAALSRLNVALEANIVYQKKLLQRDYVSKVENQNSLKSHSLATLSKEGRVHLSAVPIYANTQFGGGGGGPSVFGSMLGVIPAPQGQGGVGGIAPFGSWN